MFMHGMAGHRHPERPNPGVRLPQHLTMLDVSAETGSGLNS
jgi:hypothetical protein